MRFIRVEVLLFLSMKVTSILPEIAIEPYTMFTNVRTGLALCSLALPRSGWTATMHNYFNERKELPYKVTSVKRTMFFNEVTILCEKMPGVRWAFHWIAGPYRMRCPADHWLVPIVGPGSKSSEQVACVAHNVTSPVTITRGDDRCLDLNFEHAKRPKALIAWTMLQLSAEQEVVAPWIEVREKRGAPPRVISRERLFRLSAVVEEIKPDMTGYTFCAAAELKAPTNTVLRLGSLNEDTKIPSQL